MNEIPKLVSSLYTKIKPNEFTRMKEFSDWVLFAIEHTMDHNDFILKGNILALMKLLLESKTEISDKSKKIDILKQIYVISWNLFGQALLNLYITNPLLLQWSRKKYENSLLKRKLKKNSNSSIR